MIYLIDDSSLDNLNATYVFDEKYSTILKIIQTQEQLSMYMEKLLQANCIMIHRTFDNSQVAKEEVSQLSEDGKKIPLVIFSDGDPEIATFDMQAPNWIGGLKKKVFYERLTYFLDYYLQTHLINLLLLAYGKNYMKISVRSDATQVLKLLRGKSGLIDFMLLAELAACPAFKRLIDGANPSLGIDYKNLVETLEDSPITVDAFTNNINRIVNSFNQYGKNIYSWK